MKHTSGTPITPRLTVEPLSGQPKESPADPLLNDRKQPPLPPGFDPKGRRVMILEGWKGMLMLAALIALVASLVLSIPGVVAMILWNAIVHETFSGPTIAFHQGVLLGLMSLIGLHLVFRPRYLNIALDHGE